MIEIYFTDLFWLLFLISAAGLVLSELYSANEKSMNQSLIIIIVTMLFTYVYFEIRIFINSLNWLSHINKLNLLKGITGFVFLVASTGILITSRSTSIFTQFKRGTVVFTCFFIPIWTMIIISSPWLYIPIALMGNLCLLLYTSRLKFTEKKESDKFYHCYKRYLETISKEE